MNIGSKISFTNESLTLASKIIVAISFACAFLYCAKFNYCPTGISIGDSFTLVFFVIVFCFMYGSLIMILMSAGLIFLFIFIYSSKKYNIFYISISKYIDARALDLLGPKIILFAYGTAGIVIIIISWLSNTLIAIELTATSLVVAVIFSTIKKVLLMNSQIPTIIQLMNNTKTPHQKGDYTLLLIAIIIIPLVTSGVTPNLIEASMKIVGIKKNPSYVLLHAPYNAFVPAELQTKQVPQALGYTTFENIDVMFTGIGQKTIIQFKDHDKLHHLEIPNDDIIIIPR